MMRLVILAMAISLVGANGLLGGLSLAQEASGEEMDEAPEDPIQKSRRQKRKTRRQRRRPPKQSSSTLAAEQGRVDEQVVQASEDQSDSWFLPDWQTPGFHWDVGPILGFKLQNVTQERTSARTAQSEIGVSGGLTGVPILPGNPGLYVAPSVGYALGRVDGKLKYDETGEEEDLKYRYDRLYAKMDLQLFYGWYRHTLGLRGGRKINYEEDDGLEPPPAGIFSASIINDFGVLLLPWVSGHYTHIYRQTHFDSFDEDPFLREHDNWLHTKLFTRILAFYIDIGPGFTNTTEVFRQGEPEETKLIGRVDYLKALMGLKLFWKLGASGNGKYVYNSTEEQLGNNSKILLPDQNLYETPRVVMPEDSFIASMFIGASDLFFGLGLGWQYNVQILNVSKKNDRERETTQDNGFVVTYTVAF